MKVFSEKKFKMSEDETILNRVDWNTVLDDFFYFFSNKIKKRKFKLDDLVK